MKAAIGSAHRSNAPCNSRPACPVWERYEAREHGARLSWRTDYSIIVAGKPPTKPADSGRASRQGRAAASPIWMWGVAHKFKRSFQQLERGGLRMRLGGALPIRGFDGPNLAKEAVKDQTAKALFDTTGAVVAPIVEKHLARALK